VGWKGIDKFGVIGIMGSTLAILEGLDKYKVIG
jgi:hypothetical protein